jgi:RimJ/RimL family protein N-acetyltransferase
MRNYTIRQAVLDDLEAILSIYRNAREFMRQHGNPNQWGDTKPGREEIEENIRAGKLFVCLSPQNEILCVFYFAVETEPTYAVIDGAWLNDKPYGVVHRIARSSSPAAHGSAAFVLNRCFEQCHNLRIDTHRDNKNMQNLFARIGFQYCGIIALEDGSTRLAYQRCE